jgi:hypothetical protein
MINPQVIFARAMPHVRLSAILPGVPRPSFADYLDDGYAISYPADWQRAQVPVDRMFGGSQVFQHGDASLLVYGTVDTFPGSQIVSDYVSNLVSYAGYKKLTIAPTMTINGVTWSQGALVGKNAQTGKQEEQVIFVAQNPYTNAHYKHFEVLCRDDVASFAATNSSAFQPMLLSFRFLP